MQRSCFRWTLQFGMLLLLSATHGFSLGDFSLRLPDDLASRISSTAAHQLSAMSLSRAAHLAAFQDLLGNAAVENQPVGQVLNDFRSSREVLERAARAVLLALPAELQDSAIGWWEASDILDHHDPGTALAPLERWSNFGSILLESDFEPDLASFAEVYRDWEYLGNPELGLRVWEAAIPLRIALGTRPELRELLAKRLPEFLFMIDRLERRFFDSFQAALLAGFRESSDTRVYTDANAFSVSPRVQELANEQTSAAVEGILSQGDPDSELVYWELVALLQSRFGTRKILQADDRRFSDRLTEIFSEAYSRALAAVDQGSIPPSFGQIREWLLEGVVFLDLERIAAMDFFREFYRVLYRQDTAPDDSEVLNLACQWGLVGERLSQASPKSIIEAFIPVLQSRADPVDQLVLAERMLLALGALLERRVEGPPTEGGLPWTSMAKHREETALLYVRELAQGNKSPAAVLFALEGNYGVAADVFDLASQMEGQ